MEEAVYRILNVQIMTVPAQYPSGFFQYRMERVERSLNSIQCPIGHKEYSSVPKQSPIVSKECSLVPEHAPMEPVRSSSHPIQCPTEPKEHSSVSKHTLIEPVRYSLDPIQYSTYSEGYFIKPDVVRMAPGKETLKSRER